MSDVRNRITPETEKLLDRALREALSMGKNSIGSASSIPHLLQTPQEAASTATDPPMRGGDAEPSSAILIKDPELRAAFLRAYRACENAR
jgi:hypothetical protein